MHRGVTVVAVESSADGFTVTADTGTWTSKAVIGASGTWWRPFLPAVLGSFADRQLYTVDYRGRVEFADRRVVVVGGGNSGAQIAAVLAGIAEVTWAARRAPLDLPNDVDGHALSTSAPAAGGSSTTAPPIPAGEASLGDIVAVPTVRCVRDAGALNGCPYTHPAHARRTDALGRANGRAVVGRRQGGLSQRSPEASGRAGDDSGLCCHDGEAWVRARSNPTAVSNQIDSSRVSHSAG